MELLAAIDLVAGEAVRLVQGDFGRQTDYGDPAELARRFMDGGARWLHLVDLDAARTGDPSNRPVVARLAAAAGGRASGSRRAAGCGRSTTSPSCWRPAWTGWCWAPPRWRTRAWPRDCARRHPGSVAVGLDYRRADDGSLVAASGLAGELGADGRRRAGRPRAARHWRPWW